MMAAFSGWMKQITLSVKTQTVNADGTITDTLKNYTFSGTIQPLSPKAIALKEEGQRAWTWLQIHCQGNTQELTTNDIITFNNAQYKIMGVLDYSLNNFYEYHAIKDFQ